MNRFHPGKSSLFLMELIVNLLLFCILCGCGLMFFIKSNSLSEDTTTLHHAVSITSSIASIYEAGDGHIETICDKLTYSVIDDDKVYVYYDKEYQLCNKEHAKYYVLVTTYASTPNKADISFYDSEDTLIHSITSCYHTPPTLGDAKEVALP